MLNIKNVDELNLFGVYAWGIQLVIPGIKIARRKHHDMDFIYWTDGSIVSIYANYVYDAQLCKH